MTDAADDGAVVLDTLTAWKSIHVGFSGRLHRAQVDNQME